MLDRTRKDVQNGGSGDHKEDQSGTEEEMGCAGVIVSMFIASLGAGRWSNARWSSAVNG